MPSAVKVAELIVAGRLTVDSELIKAAVRIIIGGGVVVFPTRCLYGLGADAFNREAVARVYSVKQRSPTNPLLVLIGAKPDLAKLARTVPAAAERIIGRFWPGRVTIVFQARPELPANLTAGSGKIGVRLPAHPIAATLVQQVQRPLTGTSANLAGGPGCDRIATLHPEIAAKVDLILDAGGLKGGVGSTVVDVTRNPPQVLREGAVTAAEIQAVC